MLLGVRKLLPLLLLLTGACASLSENECQRYSLQAAGDPYLDGWWVGNATYRDRTAHDGGM